MSADSSEDALIQQRRDKAARLREQGQNPFANDVKLDKRSTVQELRHKFAAALVDEKELRYDPAQVETIGNQESFLVFGRIVLRRGFGKASFIRLRDGSGELQLFAKQDILGSGFAALETIDIADHVEARGRAMVTKTGELSIELSSIRLITKALRPLPDKWHGLTDTDIRYRRRYVDLVSNPEVAVALRSRSLVVQGLRDFLDRRDFLEVETPTLHTLVGGATARPFKTHHNALDLGLFLRIAPELYLKRLLVGGFERVYEIGRCYRNEGISTRHNPEFTMLEFYMAYATYETLMPMAEALFRHVDAFVLGRLRELGLGEAAEKVRAERPFTFDEPFARVPMKQAVRDALEKAELPVSIAGELAALAFKMGPDGKKLPSELDAAVEGYKQKSERAGRIDWGNLRRALSHSGSDGERLFVAYEYLAEPFLIEDYRSQDGQKSVPVFIVDYPFEVSPLARKKDADPTLTDRFELFVHGRELCNAFSELNDPEDQAARFQAQLDAKERGAEETMDYDHDYVMALEHGMPPAAGFGLGVDRLVMAIAGQASIRDVIAFPLARPE
ncbi:MAG: Lysyl-tRNA synthetase [Polyangiaceae bacterium]|jgi:lysyl-tRNA synthetase class 2|nr:Lysyl-tRNA synthetase [Polyangiaceae bacterium]